LKTNYALLTLLPNCWCRYQSNQHLFSNE